MSGKIGRGAAVAILSALLWLPTAARASGGGDPSFYIGAVLVPYAVYALSILVPFVLGEGRHTNSTSRVLFWAQAYLVLVAGSVLIGVFVQYFGIVGTVYAPGQTIALVALLVMSPKSSRWYLRFLLVVAAVVPGLVAHASVRAPASFVWKPSVCDTALS
jgi:hypothetical protein